MNTQDYHADEGNRVEGERYAGIVIKDQQILLIHRRKNGLEYWVFPGGHRQTGETGEDSVLREIEEETSILAQNPKLIFEKYDQDKKQKDFYYLCDWLSGKIPKLNGEEAVRLNQNNFYEPLWLDLKDCRDLNILPKVAKSWLLDYLDHEE